MELVFGNLKNNHHFKRFMLRSKPKVEVKAGLLSLAHNLRKREKNLTSKIQLNQKALKRVTKKTASNLILRRPHIFKNYTVEFYFFWKTTVDSFVLSVIL